MFSALVLKSFRELLCVARSATGSFWGAACSARGEKSPRDLRRLVPMTAGGRRCAWGSAAGRRCVVLVRSLGCFSCGLTQETISIHVSMSKVMACFGCLCRTVTKRRGSQSYISFSKSFISKYLLTCGTKLSQISLSLLLLVLKKTQQHADTLIGRCCLLLQITSKFQERGIF